MSEALDQSNEMSPRDRLTALRVQLKAAGVDGFLVPRGDEFQGEFVAPYAERLAWLTDFTGSAGLAIVLHDQAALFIDGRYTLQVRDQSDAALYTFKHSSDEPVATWLRETLEVGQRLGFDPHLHTPDQVKRYRDACAKVGAELVAVSANPIDAVWSHQPARPRTAVKVHPLSLAGQTHADKRMALAETLRKDDYDAFLVTAPDSLCWLLNVRGAEVEHTPLVLATALVFADGRASLFIDPAKVSEDVKAHLGDEIALELADGLGAVVDDLAATLKTVAADKATVSQWAVDRLEAAGLTVKLIEDPCSLPKACKNAVELNGIRAAHVRDGAALTRFLAWLDQEAPSGALTEMAEIGRAHV